MTDGQSKAFDRRADDHYYIEYVQVSTDEAAANEPLRDAINQKTQQGWRLLSMTRDPSGDRIELVWETSRS